LVFNHSLAIIFAGAFGAIAIIHDERIQRAAISFFLAPFFTGWQFNSARRYSLLATLFFQVMDPRLQRMSVLTEEYRLPINLPAR